ncbi:acetyl-CoA synthetase [Puccinia graminis f. sp. tritici]|uniref:Acetyl-coenzyme A synthetase n=1 Tax=Puccinia graminis f. sp. tritici TaxID=56615 RepID=A0A5B0QSZ8_PUCGR|nr:acetyl-CoA synthetase [Puccinia graminis f. sp. tritici]
MQTSSESTSPQEIPKLPIARRVKHLASNNKPIDYPSLYRQSLDQSDQFWDQQAKETLSWSRPYTSIYQGDFQNGNVAWFRDGGLNACYNCLDRWAIKDPNRTAIIWVADEDQDSIELTYKEVFEEVCRLANVLKSFGVKKGDTVAIYLPMIPAAAIAFLACARIGAIHSVVFAGFSADSLRDRVVDARSRVVITSDEGKRGGKTIPTKRIVDEALDGIARGLGEHVVEKVIVYSRTGSRVPMKEGRDVWWNEVCQLARPFCPIEIMDSEDPLFILYTSGSTGKPKGLIHTTAGYLLGAALTLKHVFQVQEGDRFACMADVGWITGHTYIIYGPLVNGVATTIFESTPIYPTPSRYWQAVAKYRFNQFYTAPTAIRLLKKLGASYLDGHDLSSLRVIGTVGEPINPDAWQWYNDHVGKNECAVVDTYWQTETGSIIITPLASSTETKPGSATLPFFGIEPTLLEPTTGKIIEGPGSGVLALKRPWPSMARTIYGDHKRYLDTYFKPYPGYYFTGDGAGRDSDGYYWIKGRVDDVLNVSGHRLSTAEVEAAIAQHPWIAETAVVGAPDETTGQSIYAFVILKVEHHQLHSTEQEDQLRKELALLVRKSIGPFSNPKKIVIVSDLPKTRSGKILRRVLRKIVSNEVDSLGDLSTLSDPSVVEEIVHKISASPS